MKHVTIAIDGCTAGTQDRGQAQQEPDRQKGGDGGKAHIPGADESCKTGTKKEGDRKTQRGSSIQSATSPRIRATSGFTRSGETTDYIEDLANESRRNRLMAWAV